MMLAMIVLVALLLAALEIDAWARRRFPGDLFARTVVRIGVILAVVFLGLSVLGLAGIARLRP